MIMLARLTEKNMEIFKGKNVVLLGDNPNRAYPLYRIFTDLNIKVVACYCDKINKNKLFKIFGIKHSYKKIIKPISEFENDCEKFENIIVQPIDVFVEFINNYKSKAFEIGVQVSDISGGEIMYSFYDNLILESYKNIFKVKWEIKRFQKSDYKKDRFFDNYYNKQKPKNPIFICSPAKTADHSLMFTFDYVNEKNNKKIEFCNLWHRSYRVRLIKEQNIFDNIKVIVGLRDPIAQNISFFSQILSASGINDDWINGMLINKQMPEIKNKINEYKNENNQNNIQFYWNECIDRYIYWNENIKHNNYHSIQNFVNEFGVNVLDITKYPFNKEKGYTVIKEGNIEIFVYQLEKLNSLVPELSEFVGVPITELVRGNDASDKWIVDSYKQAQKEIEITQEYFERCYNEPYVQHCYSQEDIEKFKDRWRPHIKNKS